MVDELSAEIPPSERVLDTLRKLNDSRWVLVALKPGGWGALLSRDFQVEKIPAARIIHMVTRAYTTETRNSAFAQLGWLEYEVTYETSMMLMRMPR
jgi:hypothetical protein